MHQWKKGKNNFFFFFENQCRSWINSVVSMEMLNMFENIQASNTPVIQNIAFINFEKDRKKERKTKRGKRKKYARRVV